MTLAATDVTSKTPANGALKQPLEVTLNVSPTFYPSPPFVTDALCNEPVPLILTLNWAPVPVTL